MNVSQITSQIYLGGAISKEEWHQLRRKGVSVKVSLQREQRDEIDDADCLLRIPVADLTPPTLDQIIMSVSLIESAVKVGKKVLIHCKEGIGRSAVIAAAYLVKSGMSVSRALRLLRKARPQVGPNWSQIQVLKDYARIVRGID